MNRWLPRSAHQFSRMASSLTLRVGVWASGMASSLTLRVGVWASGTASSLTLRVGVDGPGSDINPKRERGAFTATRRLASNSFSLRVHHAFNWLRPVLGPGRQ